ncbi:uncharacterized protein LOC135368941 [Ornithodoros turicata]|uniref:uncharacterized protein LOC135368941 n=1 Tax=Ornithodoros turicata TaxID=34597 RepID=UPI00313A4476
MATTAQMADDLYAKKKHKIRRDFHNREQREGESISEFYKELMSLASSHGDIPNEAICSTFIRGLREEWISIELEKMKGPDIDTLYKKAIELEAESHRGREMSQGIPATSEPSQVQQEASQEQALQHADAPTAAGTLRAMETTGPEKGAAGRIAVGKSDPDDYYLNTPRGGACIIIDVRNPPRVTMPKSGIGPIPIGKRPDSSLADKLQNTFEQWGFRVKVYVDPAKEELFQNLEKEAKGNWDMVACCFLTFVHQLTDDLCTQDGSVSIKDLTETFDGANASNLLGKPKLFFIHTSKTSREMSVCSGFSDTTSRNTLPGEPDFFICTSGQQTEGKESTDAFIEHFCKVFDKSAKTMEQQDFTELLRAVNRELLNAAVDKSDIRLPSHISTLRRRLYFRKASEQSGSSTRVPGTEDIKKKTTMHGTLKGSQKELLQMTSTPEQPCSS